jgi:addiction module HigA family antidote
VEIAPDNTLSVLTVSGEYASLGRMEMLTMSKSVTIIDPIHPGEILESEFLEPLDLSANKFAKHIHVPANRISAIIKGQRGITGDTALRLSKAFKTTPEFWMNLQSHYDLEIAKDTARDELKRIQQYAA